MSRLPDSRLLELSPARVGPGRVILVVGPSGVGKDTLIVGARAAYAAEPSVVFPRRVVTRDATAAEDHDSISEEAFRRAAAAGDFALWWEAHGLCYGIPSTINDDIRAGRRVVCNVSRTVIGFAQARYECVVVVLVTAPKAVREARLASRGRASDGNPADRITRAATAGRGVDADVVIDNRGSPDVGIARLVAIVGGDG